MLIYASNLSGPEAMIEAGQRCAEHGLPVTIGHVRPHLIAPGDVIDVPGFRLQVVRQVTVAEHAGNLLAAGIGPIGYWPPEVRFYEVRSD